ncbi:MAG: hypothetical protein EAX86_10035 [Candidatus Heimdallarchaeota archaeon]|nr:hypothetical protein [Candidatus Heimdallarchaeota archaeon]
MALDDTVDRRYLLRKFHQSKVILVADLHLGFEAEWSHRGIDSKDPSISYTIIDRLMSDINRTKANHLIILGDIFHSVFDFRSVTKGKSWKTPDWILDKVGSYFRSEIISRSEVKLTTIQGNQDGFLRSYINNNSIIPPEGEFLENYNLGVLHGNVPPAMDVLNASEIMLGHIHPMIELIDEMGLKHKLPVFARLSISREQLFKIFGIYIDEDELFDVGLIDLVKIIILPSYNVHIPGLVLNNRKGIMKKTQDFPILRKIISHPELEIQMTNGVVLGNLEDI